MTPEQEVSSLAKNNNRLSRYIDYVNQVCFVIQQRKKEHDSSIVSLSGYISEREACQGSEYFECVQATWNRGDGDSVQGEDSEDEASQGEARERS